MPSSFDLFYPDGTPIEEIRRRRSKSSERSAPVPLDYNSGQTSFDVESRISVSATSLDFFDPNWDADAEYEGDDSPYPEVRASVSNVDDASIPASTIRAWTIGMSFAVIISGVNQFFFFRYPSVAVGGLVAQLVVFPLGRLWGNVVPQMTIFGLSLNPGPFTIKEHVLATIMASVGAQSAYATEIIAVQRVYYNQVFDFGYQWMLVISTQMIGFSIGGITKRFLVLPPSMIWPSTLVQCALFNTLHSQSLLAASNHSGISRERFFLYVFTVAVVWYFFPGYLFTALSFFDWVCWIAPNNPQINQLFGYHSGLGFSVLTFDWAQIADIGSPLAMPWWAEANIATGFVLFYWFITPILYYCNAWNTQYMPVSSRTAFDNTGNNTPYNISRIIFANATLNIAEYEAYSPLFLSITFIVSYALSFLAITATITHAFLYFRKPIAIFLRKSLREQPDVHARLMTAYSQVPEWWYGFIFVVTFIYACLSIQLYPTTMEIWALLLALIIALLYIVPVGMIQAMTNYQIGLNVVAEILAGILLPGRPVALMIFKTYGYITVTQALQFTADFKLGHYMKIPPRSMFWCQIVASVIAATVQLGVQSWMFANIPDLCSPMQKDNFICAGTQVFGTASELWGVIGPARQFSRGQVYYGSAPPRSHCLMLTASVLPFFFLVGALCPIIHWFITTRYPGTFLDYVNFPLIFAGTMFIPPATATNYVPWAVIGFIFQYWIRRKYFRWWAKYNYVLSAALDAGTSVGIILVYFCLQYPLNGTIGESTISSWWGNTVYMQTLDWQNVTLRSVPLGKTFGPETW